MNSGRPGVAYSPRFGILEQDCPRERGGDAALPQLFLDFLPFILQGGRILADGAAVLAEGGEEGIKLSAQDVQPGACIVRLFPGRRPVRQQPSDAGALLLLVCNLCTQGCRLCGDVGRGLFGGPLPALQLFPPEGELSGVDDADGLSHGEAVALVEVEAENLPRRLGGDGHGVGFEDARGIIVPVVPAGTRQAGDSKEKGSLFHWFTVCLSW